MPEISASDVGNLQVVLNNIATTKLSVDNDLGSKTLAELRRQATAIRGTSPGGVLTKAPEAKPDEHLDHGRVLWLTAGHGGSDPGAGGFGHNEADLVLELRDLITAALKRKGFKYTIWNDPNNWATSQTSAYLQSRTKEGDVVFDLHFNAASPSAHGVEVIVPNNYTPVEAKLAKGIAKVDADVLQTVLRGDEGLKTEGETPRQRLAMMRPPGVNVLLETGFITNREELTKYLNGKERLADELANVLIAHFA